MCNSKSALTRAVSLSLFRKEMGQNRQSGFSLILVLFLLVVVSLLAVSLARLNSGAQQSVGQEILSVRALFAAESGAQSAAMQIFPINGGNPIACPVLADINFPAAVVGLSGCSATRTCAVISAQGRTVFTINSAGTCGSGNDIARRNLRVGLRTQ